MSSLRGRLLANFGLVVLVCTTLTVGVASLVIHARARSAQLSVLVRQADALASTPGAARVFASGGARAVRVVSPARAAAVLAAVPNSADRTGHVRIGGRTLLYAERGDPGGARVVLVRAAALGAGDAGSFGLTLILAGLGGALVAAGLAVFLSRRLTRPLHDLALATDRVARGEQAVSVDVRGRDELARLAGSFNAMSSALADARNAERSFLLTVSHELRTPLTAIQAHAEGLEDGAVMPAQAGGVIASEARRLERLISDLLDIARVSRPNFSVQLESVALAELAERAHGQFGSRAAAAGRGLAFERVGPSAQVAADPDRALQVLANLIENALRATPPGGRVTVCVEGNSVTVSDTGPGIAPADQGRAFERFYLHDRTPEERRRGSGVGLAIVRELMDAMGGEASVRSEPGEGARFTLRFSSSGESALS